MRAKLTAFAISGFLAAVAGSLLAHHQQAFFTYDAGFNIGVFTAAVIGGLGSLLGAFIGSLYWNGTFFWLDGTWRLFASGIGVLLVLLVAPGGLVSLWTDLRDLTLRWLARRRGVLDDDGLPDADDGTLALHEDVDDSHDDGPVADHGPVDDGADGEPGDVPVAAPVNGAEFVGPSDTLRPPGTSHPAEAAHPGAGPLDHTDREGAP